MNKTSPIGEILELIKIAEDVAKFAIMSGFTPAPERRMIARSIRLLQLASARIMLLTITSPNTRGVVESADAGGGGMSGTPDKVEGI